MPETGEIRKLAAVMFTDIEGYTSMFHNNEVETLEKIHLHRDDISGVLRNHNGQLIQFYGDGSLTIFDSVVDAVRSAIEIQAITVKQNLPVRIGIHLGDIVVKGENIYGDVVNVASRIQGVGIPGSIVVSKKITDELANHPEIGFIRLGSYPLKNVEGLQDLYAITGENLSLPPKLIAQRRQKSRLLPFLMIVLMVVAAIWYVSRPDFFLKEDSSLLEEKIAVPPFENFTTDDAFNAVSQMAAHWITTELIELADANVVSYPSSAFYTNTSEASMPLKSGFARQTGAVNIIRGAFGFTGADKDSLVFWASIISTKTGEPLQVEFDKAYCDAVDPLTCIRQMSNEIKGYWKSKNDKVLSPPNYNAYKEYLLARETWDGPDDSIPEHHLRESIRLDPHFLDAYFLLMDHFYNQRNPQEAWDTLRSMQAKFTDLTPRQENYMMYLEEDLKGRRLSAFNHFMKEYAIDPKDIFVNTSAMVMAQIYLNDPDKVLLFFNEIDIDSLDLQECFYCLERVMLALQAYLLKGEEEKAKQMAEKVKMYAVKRDDYHRLVEWYIATNDTASVNSLLENLSTQDLDRDYRYLSFVAGRQAMLQGNIPLRNYYADMAIRLYGKGPTRNLARAYYLKDQLETSEKIYLELLKSDSSDARLYAELGLIYAKRREIAKAESMLRKIDQLKQPFDYGETPYMKGRIKAHLGDTRAAVQLLTQALDEGQLFFNSVTFDGDPDLLILKDDTNYRALVNRYN
jgi:class 3 adenylate cyclase/tetratricopeptide (TPR) repeat protein